MSSMFLKVFALFFILKFSEQLGSAHFKKFTPAYSYLLAKNQKTPICFNEEMSGVVMETNSRDPKECVARCLLIKHYFHDVQLRSSMNFENRWVLRSALNFASDGEIVREALTDNELRGVNYVQHDGFCSCVPTANNIRNNVSAAVGLLAGGCRGYVNHECPAEFDYVIEYNKCYKLLDQIETWYEGRRLCNSLSSSHLITIDDDYENYVSLQYVDKATHCYYLDHGWYSFFTSGIRTYVGGVRTPFLWSPYPEEDGEDYCLISALNYYFGWDDISCKALLCILCEYDMMV
ncbi:hypothetical protein HELRODRAFT_163461 [Helobdella robusta]|uniref:C-type lectin domain-containing protein n=1 Tax=Helobdella robusta TaxID=6412 RepID=T1EU29_HELRO|nr:hypothetical protein HELRODRAFT_163461 [Helobdella robusta]ESN96400.1 hypothetical protein HELRODRAFT_163461 [Helobdella robusta]